MDFNSSAAIAGISATLSAILSSLLTLKLTKARKKEEVKALSITNDNSIIERYEKLIETIMTQFTQAFEVFEKRALENDKIMASQQKEIDELHRRLNSLEEENNIKNLIINEAFKCQHDFKDCPVIRLRTSLAEGLKMKHNGTEN